MKRSLLIVGLMLLVVVFIIAGCGEKESKKIELSFEKEPYKVSIMIPEDSDFMLTTKRPDSKLESGLLHYASGEGIYVSYVPRKLKKGISTFEEFVNDVTSENKATSYSNAETLEINGRKAVKYDYVIISETRKKVGYIFCMDTSDIQDGRYFAIMAMVQDKDPDSVDKVFTKEVFDVLKSTKVEKYEPKSGD